jgi:hypothetical protein
MLTIWTTRSIPAGCPTAIVAPRSSKRSHCDVMAATSQSKDSCRMDSVNFATIPCELHTAM